jgi:hypothetical protein
MYVPPSLVHSHFLLHSLTFQHNIISSHKKAKRSNRKRERVEMVQGVKIVDGFILNNDPATGELINPPIAVTKPSELVDVIAKANAAQVSRMNGFRGS